MRKDAPLSVEVPSSDRDRPGWVKVGVIAAIGFVLGVAWPRLVGVKLGPSAPGEAAAKAAASASAAPVADGSEAPSAAGAVAKSPPAASLSTALTPAKSAGAPNVTVSRGNVLSCKTDDGDAKKGKECGAVAALDALVQPRLRKLASCGAATGQTGKLSVVVTADFSSSRLAWEIGKSTTVDKAEGVAACLKSELGSVSTTGVAHAHPRYIVAYTATLSPGSEGGAAAAPADVAEEATASPKAKEPKEERPATNAGEASVEWEVALVRDTPKTGSIVARLPRGTKVKLGSAKEGWYVVRYGDDYAKEGWVYRGAFGR